MITVKEYGHIKPKEFKCSGCGAILEYTDVDIKQHNDFYYLICPVCGKVQGLIRTREQGEILDERSVP